VSDSMISLATKKLASAVINRETNWYIVFALTFFSNDTLLLTLQL